MRQTGNDMSLTPRQEKFAQAIVSGHNQSDAYRISYPKSLKWKDYSVAIEASRMMAKPNVSLRVAKLRAPIIEKIQRDAEYGLRQAMAEAGAAFEMGRANENGGAMVAAVTLKAKLNNLLVERKEVKAGLLDKLPYETLERLRLLLEVAIKRDNLSE